jgi:GMP reductase
MHSRKDVNLVREYTFRNSKQTYKGIPIIASNMHGVGTLEMASALGQHSMMTALCKDLNRPAENQSYDPLLNTLDPSTMILSTGILSHDLENVETALHNNSFINTVCIDVANGYSEKFLDFVSNFRERWPSITIIAGNVVTSDMTEELILRGADIVKVGIGNGSVCTTRIKTGVGFPQLSAVIECADAAHGLGGHIIADGGCTSPGDIAKAFGAGADFVMLGGMLAGTDQGGGEVITRLHQTNELQAKKRTLPNGENEWTWTAHKVEERKFVEFYGMSSKAAQGDTFQNYRSSEGRVVTVPYRGSVHNIVEDILGGLRSACTYVGAKSLKELSKRTTFVQVNRTYNDVYESTTVGE